ncbi:MerR family transcriptional regulator [Peribacillus sp. SCS-37]|uniref:MerR family transcriptional regulator n=1 Tax=Paraperibacillus esterisolvens TaxID=3115296 RepID=UPI003906639F
MERQVPKYNIKAASTLLGIKSGTLRAWERRYQFIAPIRNESGHRMYTEEHIQILKWLISKIHEGFTISQAVSLLETIPEKQFAMITGRDIGEEDRQQNVLAAELTAALLSFNEMKSHELLDRIFSLYSLEKAVGEILAGVMLEIGDLWERKEINSAHEHFASAILRSRIGYIIHTIPQNSLLPKACAVCCPGEWHEVGLLIFTLHLRLKGFQVVYLGPSLAEGDLRDVLPVIEPRLLFFSCTLQDHLKNALQLIDQLKKEFPAIHIGMGGKASTSLTPKQAELYGSHIIGEKKAEWDQWLRKKLERL